MYSYSAPVYFNSTNLKKAMKKLPNMAATSRLYKMAYVYQPDAKIIPPTLFNKSDIDKIDQINQVLGDQTLPISVIIADEDMEKGFNYST